MNPGKQEGGGAKIIKKWASFLFEISCSQRRVFSCASCFSLTRHLFRKPFLFASFFSPYRRVCPKKLTRVAAPSPRASLGRLTVCGRTEQRRPPVSKRYATKVRMVWGSFLIAIAAAALKTPTRNGYNAQGVNLTFLLVCAG